jgi:hypothetical protein
MKRTKVLFGQRRFQLLVSLAALVVAVMVVVGSGASFTAHSANPSNVYSAGTLAMSNTPTGINVAVEKWVPGDLHNGTVKIENTGNVQGHFYLEPVTISGNTKGFAQDLQLQIKDGDTIVYSGALSGLIQEDLGIWKAGESHTYAFIISFPDQGRDSKGVGLDNDFMGATTTAQFDWTAVSVARGSI